MIITGFLARFIVWVAAKIVPGTVGVTIWPFIFIWPKKWAKNKKLVKHEQKHLEQYKRYWIVGFLPVYIYYSIKYGYWDNPLEIEARKAADRR